jgi:hypothetical protein
VTDVDRFNPPDRTDVDRTKIRAKLQTFLKATLKHCLPSQEKDVGSSDSSLASLRQAPLSAGVAVGYLLDEIKNDPAMAGRETPASCELTIDYVVTNPALRDALCLRKIPASRPAHSPRG